MAVDTSKAIHKPAPKMTEKQMVQYVKTMRATDNANNNKANNSKKRKVH